MVSRLLTRGFPAMLCIALMGLAAPVAAQVTTGQILGTVKDSSGGVLPGVTVTATNVDTNVARTTVTNDRGEYSLQFVPVGRYQVEAGLDGFKRFLQTGVVIELSRTARVDPVLQVGARTEEVVVRADAPLVDTAHVALGRTVSQTEILNLPLVDRDVYALLDLTAGIDASDTTNTFGIPGQQTLVNGSANTGAGAVNYSLDGGANMSGLRQTGNIVPNPDAIQEFRVQTNSYSAEHGRFGGAIVDVITKSGTNRFKGSLFEFFRDDNMNADRWTAGEGTLRKELFERNNFGGSFGGPIFRDRTFFFATYNGIRQTTANYEAGATVPSALERGGDFSQSGGIIKDPLTGRPFPGNRIPANRFDPVAVRILNDWIPLPNLPDNGYEVEVPVPLERNEFSLKLDHNLTATNRLSGSYFLARGSDHDPLNGDLPWTDRVFEWDQHNVNISNVWTLSNSMVNELHFTFVHNVGGRVNLPATSLADYGSAFVMQGAPALPLIDVSGYFELDTPIAGTRAGGNTYQIREALSLNRGNHSLRFGGSFFRESLSHFTTLDNYGEFEFDGDFTGDGFADFLLGLPTRIDQDAPIDKFDNSTYLSVFFQDDYRVHPRLTLNLGLRYDLQFPLSDPQNRKLTFVEGYQSTVVPGAFPGMLFPGDEGPDGRIPNTIADPDYNNVAPRLGFAWDVAGDGRTAVRGAFGVFYGAIGGNQWNATADNQPFAIRQNWDGGPEDGTLSQPYLTFGGVSPFPYVYDPNNIRFILPASLSGIALDYDIPYTYQFNVAVQRQLTSDLSATVAYVGNRGRNLPFTRNLNYPRRGTGSVNSRRPILPGTLGNIQILDSFLTNQYDGLQLTVDKRFSHHFLANASYTFGKSFDDAELQRDTGQSVQNLNDILADRGRTSNDRRHQYKMSLVWTTDYFRESHSLASAILDGWTVSGIVKLRSGRPLTIRAGRDANADGTNNDRANLVSGADPMLDSGRSREEQITQWFNTAAFAAPANLTDGNSPRNFIEGPGSKLIDIGIFRDFPLGGGRKLQLRVEATNAFNFVNLDNPTTNIRSSSFGKIDEAGPMRRIQLGARFSF